MGFYNLWTVDVYYVVSTYIYTYVELCMCVLKFPCLLLPMLLVRFCFFHERQGSFSISEIIRLGDVAILAMGFYLATA